MKNYPTFLFSIAVALAMNALDMAYHLATGWTVHLNYVAVKFTIIFLSVWMITRFIGIGKEEGVVASILGPFIFYIYYVFATPTLNRQIFHVDEEFWFMFLHLALMLIAYFAAFSFAKSKRYWTRTLSFIITASFMSVAMYALYFMIKMRLQGIDEEAAAKAFTFAIILIPLTAYSAGVIIQVLLGKISGKKYWNSLHAPVLSAIIIYLTTKDVMHAVAAFVFVNLAYFTINNYKKGIASAQ